MNPTYRCILIILCFIFIGNLNAQEKAEEKEEITWPSYTVAVQPFYLTNGGLRFDLEKRLKNPKHWLQLGVAGYYLPNKEKPEKSYWETMGSYYDDITELKGLGITGNYKSFLPTSRFVYTSAGLSYNYYNIKYPAYGFIPYVDDDMTFYERKQYNETQNINKLTANACIGLQTSLRYLVFMDTYLGLGYTYSFYDQNKNAFNDGIFGYGYRGITIVGGVRLGFTVK